VNILFILAMLAGFVILSRRGSNSYAVEAFLLLQIIPISYFLISHPNLAELSIYCCNIEDRGISALLG
jgi:hypothetical protein